MLHITVLNEMLTSAGIKVTKNSNEKENVHSYHTMHFFKTNKANSCQKASSLTPASDFYYTEV